MSQPRWLVKHPEVEEAFDLLFYRPVGYGVSLLLRPLPVTPDHVSLAAAAVGLLGGHLLFYGRPAADLAGALALVVSALFDSVDGQLARLRGTHSAHGRMHDGFSDSVVFIGLYLHLGARLVREGGHPALLLVAVAALVCQFSANAMADLYRNSYLRHGLLVPGAEGDSLREVRARRDEARRSGAGPITGLLLFFYERIAAQQEAFNPSLARVRSRFDAAGDARERLAGRYRELFRPLLPQLFWLGTNVRLMLLLVLLALGAASWFFWLGLTALNLALFLLVRAHDRRARTLLAEDRVAAAPAPEGSPL
jgi:phosphatidylglycerophosphate synthase